MAHQFASAEANPTAVAIDKDKQSHYAVKWAIDNLLITNPSLVLIHVRNRTAQNETSGVNSGSTDANGNTADADLHQLFLPFRGYCARKGILLKEVVLEGVDIAKTIVDYVNQNLIVNIVCGSSSRSPIARKLWPYDVPLIVSKSAADFCSVYVIAKTKIQSSRPATRTAMNTLTPRPMSPFHQNRSAAEDEARSQRITEGRRSTGSENSWTVKGPANKPVDAISFRGRRKSSNKSLSGNEDFLASPALGSMDITAQNVDFTCATESTQDGAPNATAEAEAEMRRLKLELKQTMDMYNTACKEAVSAKKKAKEIQEWKMEESRRVDQARMGEEAALVLVEMEKAKCKAAIEAAEKAQKLAEMEAKRRKLAELKAKNEEDAKNRALTVLSKNDIRYRKYAIEEIEGATNNFSRSLKIGEGGYGPVFKAKLDHTPVAIKVLRPDAAQGKKQFQQEVEVLSCIRHPNMVLLLGACPEYGCLVYEFMNYGSLEDRLFRKGNTSSMPWSIRFKIAAEIATGLLFLHQTKPEPLVHRDLKPANILLDRNYECKISDVGLSRLVPASVADSVTRYHMTSAAGTFCYIDPEYQQTGKLGTKSDIYSLGVMLLQIITAKPPMGLSHHFERAIEKGTFAEFLDPTVPDWPIVEALSFAKLSLQCVQLRKKDRPDLGSVIVPELNRLKQVGMESLGQKF